MAGDVNGGMCGRECVVGYMHGRGCVWLGAYVVGGIRAGETATEAGGTLPSGMHSCLKNFESKLRNMSNGESHSYRFNHAQVISHASCQI